MMNAFLFLFNTFVLHASELANFCDTVTSNEWTYTQKWVNKCRIMDDAQIKDKKNQPAHQDYMINALTNDASGRFSIHIRHTI